MSGIMATHRSCEESGPTRAGFAVCDVLSGATAAFGVSSALFQRNATGKGQLIDVSMLEATLAFLSGQVADYSVAGHRQQLSGNQAVSRKPTANLFKAGDGHLLLAVNNGEAQYQALMKAHFRPRGHLQRSALAELVQRGSEQRAGAARDHRGAALEKEPARMGENPRCGAARPAPASGRSRR